MLNKNLLPNKSDYYIQVLVDKKVLHKIGADDLIKLTQELYPDHIGFYIRKTYQPLGALATVETVAPYRHPKTGVHYLIITDEDTHMVQLWRNYFRKEVADFLSTTEEKTQRLLAELFKS